MSSEKKSGIEGDSAVYYYTLSMDKELSTREKLHFLNRSLIHSLRHKDSMLLKGLSQKVYLCNILKQYDSSLYYAEKLIRYAEESKDTLYLAKGYYRKARVLSYIHNPRESFKSAIASQKYYQALGDSVQVGMRLVEMAISQERLGDYSGSQESASEGISYLDRNQHQAYFAIAHNCIAISYRKQKLYENAIWEYHNGLTYVTSGRDSISFINNMAIVQRDMGNIKAALVLWDAIDTSGLPAKTKARILDNRAYAGWLENPGINVSNELNSAMKIRVNEEDIEGLQASFDHLSRYFEDKDPSKALFYAERYLEVATAYNNSEDRLDALKRLVNLTEENNTKRYATQYMVLNDSIETARLQTKNAFSKIKYDYTREEQQKLKYKSAKEKAEILLRNEKTENLILITIVIGLSVIGYLWNSLQKTREQARISRETQEAIYNTEIRLSKKVHDELANGIYNVMTQMEENEANEEMLDRLEKIYNMTRDISRESIRIDTGPAFAEELGFMLGSYPPGDTKIVILGLDDVPWSKITTEKKIVLYRVLQELMTNMKKHSRATFVGITFLNTSKVLKINYSDNGISIPSEMLKFGNGLRNTENRILFVNGCITFDTDKGFRAEIELPY